MLGRINQFNVTCRSFVTLCTNSMCHVTQLLKLQIYYFSKKKYEGYIRNLKYLCHLSHTIGTLHIKLEYVLLIDWSHVAYR